jgi:hypothetical protein
VVPDQFCFCFAPTNRLKQCSNGFSFNSFSFSEQFPPNLLYRCEIIAKGPLIEKLKSEKVFLPLICQPSQPVKPNQQLRARQVQRTKGWVR